MYRSRIGKGNCPILSQLPVKISTVYLRPKSADCMERAAFLTGSALDAFADIDGVRLFQFSGNGGDRAEPCTFGTALTKFRVNLKAYHCFTLACRTFFIHYMSNVFVTEILKRRYNR